MAKNFNPNLAKIHRNYTVEEVANLYGVHKNTVRAWINKHGLLTNDDMRPILILGSHLREYLQERRTKNKCKCLPHEVFCLKCKKPQVPAGNMAEYISETDTRGRLISLCPVCESLVNRYITIEQVLMVQGRLDITLPEGTRTHNQED